jgi:hypothetical protein
MDRIMVKSRVYCIHFPSYIKMEEIDTSILSASV